MTSRQTEHRPTPFGLLLEKYRIAGGAKTLRALASEINITHVGLGDVIRGKRLMLSEEYWPALIQALPGLTMEELYEAAERSRAQEIRPWHFEGPKRELAARMAATAHSLDVDELDDEDLHKLLEALRAIRRIPS